MKLKNNTIRFQTCKLACCACLCSVLLLQGCAGKTTMAFASHKATLTRAGITLRQGVEELGDAATYHYDGYCYTGTRLKVDIKNDDVFVDGKLYGRLNKGDVIVIADDGLRVNSLDNGETEKYLRANNEQSRQ